MHQANGSGNGHSIARLQARKGLDGLLPTPTYFWHLLTALHLRERIEERPE
jgi:hypothetical protein